MESNMSKIWSSKMPQGVELQISHHSLKLKNVVNLIIALDRLKSSRSESLLGTEFRDENLLNIMLESIVEEQTVFERHSAQPAEYSRTGEHQCSVTDSNKRSLVLVQNSMELHAVMLQGGAEDSKVYLNMSTYVHAAASAEARTVALAIKGTNLYLSCHKDGDEPTLHLEAVENKDRLSSVSQDSDMLRFLFYKHDTGVNNSTLVSVPFSQWYISTAQENNQPVKMCLENAPRHRFFNIQTQS